MTTWTKLAGISAVACAALLATACSGDDDDNVPVSITQNAGSVVHVKADVTVASGSISKITLSVGSAITGLPSNASTSNLNEKMEIPSDIKMVLRPPTGPDTDITSLLVRDSDTQAHTSGPISVSTAGLNHIVITGGASGAVILTNLGTTNTSTTLGSIDVAFTRNPDGTLVAPTEAGVAIPTGTTTLNEGATFRGLAVGTHIDATLKAQSGTLLHKTADVTTASSTAAAGTIIADLAGGVKASDLSGKNSALTLTFTKP